MFTKPISAACALILNLVAVSCSPIVAEYTYRGTVTGTSGGQTRELTLKEYKDGTVSGKLSIPSSTATEPFSCGSIGGRIDGRKINFTLTSLGQSYLSAKMSAMTSSTGTTIAYRGNISGNRYSLSGKWHAANDYRSHLRGGSFSFHLTRKNGRAIRRKTASGKTGAGTGGMPSFSVESTGNNTPPAGQQPVSFTVE